MIPQNKKIILTLIAASFMALASACCGQEEDTAIEKVKNCLTSSGKTIEQIIEENTEKLIKTDDGWVSYDKCKWTADNAPQDKGYIVSCMQGAVFYAPDKRSHSDGARVLKWYYERDSVRAIPPNDPDTTPAESFSP